MRGLNGRLDKLEAGTLGGWAPPLMVRDLETYRQYLATRGMGLVAQPTIVAFLTMELFEQACHLAAEWDEPVAPPSTHLLAGVDLDDI